MNLQLTSRQRLARKLALVTLSTLFFLPIANAARVSQVKGSALLLDLESEGEVSVGERYIIMVGDKRRAVVEITKVRGMKAQAKSLKGKPSVGGTTVAMSEGKSSSSSSSNRSSNRRKKTNSNMFSDITIGVIGGYSSASQTVKALNTVTSQTESISMSGSGFSLKAFGDLPISGALGLTGRFGFEQFNVTGNASKGAVKTEILYATADLLFRYQFAESGTVPFVHGGLGLHFPVSKSSDVLDVQRVSSTTIFFFGGGLNYAISDTMFIHGVAEYGLFPPSNDVTTSMISVRGGVGWPF